ncbi:hydroxymethylglutaryl-CoA lyase [Nocardioides sp. BYT-33-1]|uniref:hydroxymethylglutaryl-CoA lyase n=1 Tax=Nocardioides sp. BYT-33-1 TaxID=3416952 RepID=UPI003F52DEC9
MTARADTLGLPARHPGTGLPAAVTVYEVGARDGLQAEKRIVPTTAKVTLIQDLLAAGLPVVEATSFVSPRWVPQLADAAEVLAGLGPDLSRHPVLVPNRTGLRRALDAGARGVAVFVSATEAFARSNLNRSLEQALDAAVEVAAEARSHGLRVRGYVSMCFGDPWEGPVAPARVAAVSRALVDAGCEQVSLGDTIGVGTAGQVRAVVDAHGAAGVGPGDLALHFHDTYGQALANVYAGLQAGVTCFDSSVAGLGGCPFAGSATGNLATEDLLWMLAGLGIETGVDLMGVVRAGVVMADLLARPLSRVAAALLG